MTQPMAAEARERQRLSLDEAINQVRQHYGFDPVEEIEVGDEVFVVRAKMMRQSEQVRRMNELDQLVKDLDHDDVERINPTTGEIVVHPKTGEPVTDRRLITPHQQDKQLLDPPYEFRYLAALWGEEQARRFEELGGSAGLVMVLEARMDDQLAQWRKGRERQERALEAGEPKSDRSADRLEVVRAGD